MNRAFLFGSSKRGEASVRGRWGGSVTLSVLGAAHSATRARSVPSASDAAPSTASVSPMDLVAGSAPIYSTLRDFLGDAAASGGSGTTPVKAWKGRTSVASSKKLRWFSSPVSDNRARGCATGPEAACCTGSGRYLFPAANTQIEGPESARQRGEGRSSL